MSFLSALRQRLRPHRTQLDSETSVYRVLAEESSDVLIHMGSDGRVTYVSPSIERLLGYSSEQIVGTNMLWLVPEQDVPALVEAIASLRSGTVRQLRHQTRWVRADGTTLWIEGSSVVADNGTDSIVLVVRDIDDRKRLEDELSALALQDSLTGLSNRRSFDRNLDLEWHRTLHERTQLSLLLLDLDHFKQFNDEYGHQAGDDCLRAVAATTKSMLSRAGDLACRYGGEELAVILSGTSAEAATEIAERIRAGIESLAIPHQNNPGAQVVTVSIGIATALARIGGTMRMPEGLLAAADHALYRAKHEGRNRSSQSLLFAPALEASAR